mmetsp:Transcript_28522/g.41971  ORF Transcript_28522/g.41971 Transcript_28522/m.41971 type:complete len:150 (-) Transcript_28522:109-558(-)
MVKNSANTSSLKCYWLLLLLAFLSTQPGSHAFVPPKNTVIFQQNGKRDYNDFAPSISTDGQHIEKYEVATTSLAAVSVSGGGEEASRLEKLSKFASKNFFSSWNVCCGDHGKMRPETWSEWRRVTTRADYREVWRHGHIPTVWIISRGI